MLCTQTLIRRMQCFEVDNKLVEENVIKPGEPRKRTRYTRLYHGAPAAELRAGVVQIHSAVCWHED